MSTVPYTFANQSGVIPLNELDENFAAVANVIPEFCLTAGAVTQGNQPNITGVGILNSLTVSGNIATGSITAGPITGTLQTGNQPNITQIGNLTNLTVANTITAGDIVSTSITGAIVTGSQPAITQVGVLSSLSVSGGIAGTLTTNAQPNITSVGTLTSLVVNGPVVATLATGDQPNITSVGNLTSLNVSGNITGGNLSGTGITGTVLTSSQPNITSLGTLVSLNVTNAVNAASVNAATVNSTNLFTGSMQSLGTISGASVTSSGTVSAVGNITTGGSLVAAGNIVGKIQGFDIGYREIPQIVLTGSATLGSNDGGKHYYYLQPNNITLTVPLNSSVSLPVGTAITVINQSTGTISISPSLGVGLFLAGNSSSSSRSLVSFGMATLVKVQTDIWFINGTGLV
jgi:hypothetical protein